MSVLQLLRAFRISSACSWSTQKTMVLPKRSVFLRKSVKIPGNRLGARFQSDNTLEILRAVFAVGNFSPIPVEFSLCRPPAGGVHGRDDPMHTIRRQEAVIDALLQAVGVERIAEISVGVSVVFAQRRCGHAELKCRLEIFENLAPVALVAGAAAMALIHDDEVEEVSWDIRGISPGRCSSRAIAWYVAKYISRLFIALPFDLPARIAERREGLVLRIVHEDVPVGEIQNARTPIFAGSVPARVPQLVADLKCNDGFAGACRERQEHAALALQDRLHRAVDRDLLVVPWRLSREVVIGSEHAFGGLARRCLGLAQTAPQLVRRREAIEVVVPPGQKIVLDDAVSVRRIGKLEPENLGVFLRLLKPVARVLVDGLCFDNRNRKIRAIPEKVVRALLRPALDLVSGDAQCGRR